MAITPRTVFSNPATAAMTAVSVLAVAGIGFYALGSCTKASSCKMRLRATQAQTQLTPQNPCEPVRQAHGMDKSRWSELQWFQYANCFAQQNQSRHVVEISSQALNYYPRSEAMFNLKGYHQLQLREHRDAIETLTLGLQRVGRPTSGTMANNLAWASLWSPRDLKLQDARRLYVQSLEIEPDQCETLHTGMWVEYALLKQGQSFERVEAMRRFHDLSERYTACHTRYQDGTWHALTEVLGAAVLIADVSDGHALDNVAPDSRLLHEVTTSIMSKHSHASADYLCRESIPLDTAHHKCVELLSQTQVKAKPTKKPCRLTMTR